jgi:hypothetical protein
MLARGDKRKFGLAAYMCVKSFRSSRAPDQIAVEVVAAAFRPAAFAHRNDEKDARLKAAATKARFCPAIRRERLPPARSFLRVKRRPLQNHRRPTFRRGGEAQARNIRRQKRRQAAELQTARALETQLSALDELSPSIYAEHSPATRCGTRKTRMLARPCGIALRQRIREKKAGASLPAGRQAPALHRIAARLHLECGGLPPLSQATRKLKKPAGRRRYEKRGLAGPMRRDGLGIISSYVFCASCVSWACRPRRRGRGGLPLRSCGLRVRRGGLRRSNRGGASASNRGERLSACA